MDQTHNSPMIKQSILGKIEHKALKVNDSRVIFINPKTLKEETVDVSRLIRVFVNNYETHKRSVK